MAEQDGRLRVGDRLVSVNEVSVRNASLQVIHSHDHSHTSHDYLYASHDHFNESHDYFHKSHDYFTSHMTICTSHMTNL